MRRSLAEHPAAYLPTLPCPGCCRRALHTSMRKGRPGLWGRGVALFKQVQGLLWLQSSFVMVAVQLRNLESAYDLTLPVM